jgi:alanine dehydrogenase
MDGGTVGGGPGDHAGVWLSERDVVSLVDLPAAITALEAGLRAEAAGAVAPLDKTYAAWGEGGAAHTLHALGAVDTAAHLAGVKTWAHTAGGAEPLLVLWDTETGCTVAVIEAFALGQLRTAAATGVATKHLAADNASRLAVIGSGKQAPGQVAAVAAVRALERITVFSPTAAHRLRFAALLRDRRPDVDVVEVDSPAAAAKDAHVVVTVTRARTPVLHAVDLAPGTHVNAVGAITPERAELAADIVAGASAVVVDAEAPARRLASELVGAGTLTTLAQLVARGDGLALDRPATTVFKAMGTGLADLAVGTLVLARARQQHLGRPLPARERAVPDLWSRP